MLKRLEEGIESAQSGDSDRTEPLLDTFDLTSAPILGKSRPR